MGCGCAERRAAINAAVNSAWQRVRGLGLMRNGLLSHQERLAAERIAQRAEAVRRQQELARMIKRPWAR
jgi:hypothetical protein